MLVASGPRPIAASTEDKMLGDGAAEVVTATGAAAVDAGTPAACPTVDDGWSTTELWDVETTLALRFSCGLREDASAALGDGVD